MFKFHREEQFDIIKGGIKNPLLVIAWVTPNSYSRLFCLWLGGVWFRWLGKRRLCWQWGGTTKRAADLAYCACLHVYVGAIPKYCPKCNKPVSPNR